jgi:hypothetical protein
MNMFRVLFCTVILFSSFSFALSQPTAEERLEGFLKAMGGRKNWAAVKGVHLTVIHHTTTVRLPFKNVIWNDFETPRHRIEASNAEYKRTLIWQKSGENWLKRDDEKAQILTEEQKTNESRWWESNPYRTIYRLAKRDKEISVKLIEPDRLAIFRADGVRLCWFRLNQLNEPIAFGTWDAEDGTIFGPLTEANFGLKHPKWTARPDGRWRAESVKFEFYKEPMKFETGQP